MDRLCTLKRPASGVSQSVPLTQRSIQSAVLAIGSLTFQYGHSFSRSRLRYSTTSFPGSKSAPRIVAHCTRSRPVSSPSMLFFLPSSPGTSTGERNLRFVFFPQLQPWKLNLKLLGAGASLSTGLPFSNSTVMYLRGNQIRGLKLALTLSLKVALAFGRTVT
jgi:hypothetical protein